MHSRSRGRRAARLRLVPRLEQLETRDVPAPLAGAGTGLVANYFADPNWANLAATGVSPTVDANWIGAPAAGAPADGFSVRWAGKVQAQFTETYTFRLANDDLAKLWVNGQLLVNDAAPGGTVEKTTTVAMKAGETYDLRLEYADVSGASEVRLRWNSASTALAIVPSSQLYPNGSWLGGGFLAADVGATGTAGSFTSSGGTYAVAGGGSGVGGTADSLRLGYRSLLGDGSVVARVDGYTAGGVAARAGVTARDGLAADAAFVGLSLSPDGRAFFEYRTARGAAAVGTPIQVGGGPMWLRLDRDGNTFTAYTAAAGAWELAGRVRVSLPRAALFGVTAAAGGATVSNLSVRPTVEVGAGLDGLADYSRTMPFVDVVKTARAFGPVDAPWLGGAPLDAQRQPTTDFGFVAFVDVINTAGVYRLSFRGTADVTAGGGDASVRNQSYDAASNTTTAEVVVGTNNPNANLFMHFRNTRRVAGGPANSGVTGVKLLRPGYADADVYTRPFLQQAGRFNQLRFMDWTSTNNNPVVRWSDRTLPTDTTQATPRGAAWEHVIELANLMHKDPWINVPVGADDDYVRQLAALFRDRLAPDLKVYVEYSNEIWNSGFGQFGANLSAAVNEVEAGIASGNPSPLVFDPSELKRRPDGTLENDFLFAMRRVGRRLGEIGSIFASVYGQSAINDRVRPVLAGQAGSPWVVRQGLEYIEKRVGAPRDVISAIAAAPYFEMRHADGNPNLTEDQVLAALNEGITDQETGTYSKALVEQVGLAVRYGVQWTAYEGGPDTYGGNNIAAKRDASRDARMQDLVQRYLRVWAGHGGGQFNWFVTGAGSWDTQYGTWTLSEDINVQDTPKIRGIDATLAGDKAPVTAGTPLPNAVDARLTLGADRSNEPYLRYLHRGDTADYLVRAPVAGFYRLTFDAATPGGNERLDVSVNGTKVATVTLTNTGDFTNWGATDAGIVWLDEGLNVVRLAYVNEERGWFMRSLTFAAEPSDPAPPPPPPPPPPTNQPPTVASPPTAAASPVTGTATALTVLGADDGGEPNLTYTWSASGPAAVGFSVNGTNAAKNTVATFTRAGDYTFTVILSDGSLTTSGTVTVRVAQTLTSIAVSPSTASVTQASTRQFSATARDQFGQPLTSQPAFTWSVVGAGGAINQVGLYTAPASGTPTETIRATAGGVTGTATVTVTPRSTTGRGLRATYYNNKNLTAPVLTRTDATVNFDWGTGSPAPGVGAETFSVVWEGTVQGIETGTYYFRTVSDDGVRVWINGWLMVSNWGDHAATTNTTPSVYLRAGERATIRIEYYDNTGRATMKFSWLRPGQTSYQIVPQSQLYEPGT